MQALTAFKAYDVRGRIPDELNETLVYDIGRAYAAFVRPKRVVVGRDIRLTSAALAESLTRGLLDCGVDVADIGLCGTEGVYYATAAGDGAGGVFDGGIMVTASHNPPDYNGLKFVREGARPISAETGLREMAALIGAGDLPGAPLRGGARGTVRHLDVRERYTAHLLEYVDRAALRPLKVEIGRAHV